MPTRVRRAQAGLHRRTLPLGLAVVLMNAGCVAPKAPTPGAEASKAPPARTEKANGPRAGAEKPYGAKVLAARHSLGPIALGLTEGEVARALGQPAKRSGGIDEAATGLTISVWSYPELGLELSLARSEAEQPALLERMTVAAPCQFITNRGIAVGATRAAVDAAYAADYSKEEPPNEERVVVDSIYDGLIFSFENGKVSSMFFGAAAE